MCLAALTFSACGGGGTEPSGLVQIATFIVSPSTVTCGGSPTIPLTENPSPDTVAVRAELVNTTPNAVTLASAGISGFVLRSDPDTADIGTMEINYPSVPYTPASVVARARDGDVNVIMSVPMRPICSLKAPFSIGTQDIQITARLTTNSGLYNTSPAILHVEWLAPGTTTNSVVDDSIRLHPLRSLRVWPPRASMLPDLSSPLLQ